MLNVERPPLSFVKETASGSIRSADTRRKPQAPDPLTLGRGGAEASTRGIPASI